LNNNKLKLKKADRNLQELFRNKLENFEIIPDPLAGAELMRKLAFREFLHFNPLRFNVYYLSGLIATAVATIAILTSSPRNNEIKMPENIQNDLPIYSKTEAKRHVEPVISVNKSADNYGRVKSGTPVSHQPKKKNENVTVVLPPPESINRDGTPPSTIKESLKGKSLFSRTYIRKPRLQERFAQGRPISISSVSEGCAPLKVLFHNRLTQYDSCLWTFGDGGSSIYKDPEWIYDVEGEYKAVLNIWIHGALIATSSAVISVYPKPAARFEIMPEKAVIPDDQVRFQNYSSNAVSYFWSFGDGSTSEQFEPLHKYEKYGRYNVCLKVASENGCADSLVFFNAFSGSAFFIEFPNAFIPSADGPSGGAYSIKSDELATVFHPSYSGVSEYNLKIFSKLGVLLFETNDINIGWDGYYKGQLCNIGVYIWKVRGNYSNGESFTKMGDLTLLKK
jgi:PKD repeat protein